MRDEFERQLALLNEELTTMGGLIESAIANAVKALDGDEHSINKAYDYEKSIDNKEREIESLCLKLLLTQQPVASDLRLISAALKMITDMERIGDQSADIAEIITTAHISASGDTFNISDMAQAAIKMVTESIDAFVKKDIDIARSVIEYDDVVDGYFDKIKSMLIEKFSKPETDGEYALDLLMITKYYERIADHAVNIAGWVLFSITGLMEGVK